MARSYGLRTIKADRTSHNGFKWSEGIGSVVRCNDWDPTDRCGGGIHFLPMGEGNARLLNWDTNAIWLVVSFDAAFAVAITEDGGGKSKAREVVIEYEGDRYGAAEFLIAHGADKSKIPCVTLTGGDRSTLTGGYRSTLTGGDGSTLTGGYRSTLAVRWWDGKRYRLTIGLVEADDLKPNVKYRIGKGGAFEEGQ